MKSLKPQSLEQIEQICIDFGVSVLGIGEKDKSIEIIHFCDSESPIDVQKLKWKSTNKDILFKDIHINHIENILIKYQNKELPKNCSGLRTYQWIAIFMIECVLRAERTFLHLTCTGSMRENERDALVEQFAEADMRAELLHHSILCSSQNLQKKRSEIKRRHEELDELTAQHMYLMSKFQDADNERTKLRSQI